MMTALEQQVKSLTRQLTDMVARNADLVEENARVRALLTEYDLRHNADQLALAQTGGVTVKGLVWVEGWGGRLEDIPRWEGRSSIGMSFGFDAAGLGYTAHSEAPADWVASEKDRLDGIYKARIRAALIPTPAKGEV